MTIFFSPVHVREVKIWKFFKYKEPKMKAVALLAEQEGI